MDNVIFVEDSFYIRFLCISGAISLMLLAIVVFVQAAYSMRQSSGSEMYFRTMADGVRQDNELMRRENEKVRRQNRLLEIDIEKNKLEIQQLKNANDTST